MYYLIIELLYRIRDLQKNRKVISSLEELDEYFVKVHEAFSRSSDEGMHLLSKIRFKTPKLPADPFSDEYKQIQLDLYKKISARNAYSAKEAEKSEFDIQERKIRPFPYFTESPSQVAEQYFAIGHIINSINPKPKSEILEFGPGWGNITSTLLKMGHSIDVVEIDENMQQLLNYRAESLGMSINIFKEDMALFTPQKQYDAILFYESFHHCSDHIGLIEKLEKAVKPSGVLVFGSEPITYFPYPWGLRLDGQSLWMIRNNGWLELGFSKKYFYDLLEKKGWNITEKTIKGIHIAKAIVCTRK